jgi:hypothetical protein
MSKTSLLCLVLATALAACGKNDTPVTSHAYGHADNDKKDTTNFVNVYPKTVGTRLDSCQTCHKPFDFTSKDSKGSIKHNTKSACDYCHLINRPDMQDDLVTPFVYDQPQPTKTTDTLNAFGLAYMQAGRTQQALRDIAGQDSDGDTHTNADEIAANRYPGDATSNPSLPFAPKKIVTVADVKAMTPTHTEFLLANSSKQQYDYYATYKGLKIRDLLAAVGVNPDDSAITSVTIIAPDSFASDYPTKATSSSKQYWFNEPFPNGLYYGGLSTSDLGTTCGFVTYPNTIPAGLTEGGKIPDAQWLMLGYERDGAPLDQSNMDPTSLRLNGEGPLRLIVPQKTPGKPDRGSGFTATCPNDPYQYYKDADHNAGAMVRGVIAIRINPMPAGLEEFDYLNGGYDYLATGQLIIYGYGIQ